MLYFYQSYCRAGFSKGCSSAFVRGIDRFKYWIVALWFILIVLAGIWGPKFLDALSFAFTPPPGSGSSVFLDAMNTNFAEQSNIATVVILISTKNPGQSLLAPPVVNSSRIPLQDFSLSLQSSVTNYVAPGYGKIVRNFLSYYTLPASVRSQSEILDQVLRRNNTLSIIQIDYLNADLDVTGRPPVVDEDFNVWLQKELDSLNYANYSLDVSTTGLSLFLRDMRIGVAHDLETDDSFTLPIALLILMIMLGSFKIMLIPLINIITCAGFAFLVMYPVAIYVSVASFAPSLMMSSTIALSIDYSLFLLTRFREERGLGKDVLTSVTEMVQHAGHNVVVSGSTIMVSFMGLILCPLDMLATVGVGTSISIFFCITVNMIMTPVWILIFPNFFGTFWKRSGDVKSDDSPLKTFAFSEPSEDKMISPFYSNLGKLNVRFRWFIVIIIIGVTIPCVPYAIDYIRTDALADIVPRNADSLTAFKTLENEFGAGVSQPINILFINNNKTSPLSNVITGADSFFDDTNAFVIDLLNRIGNLTTPYGLNTHVGFGQVTGMGSVGVALKAQFPTSKFKDLLNLILNKRAPIVGNELIFQAYDKYVSPDNSSTFIDIRLPVDPMSPAGEAWLLEMRRVMAEILPNYTNRTNWIDRNTTVLIGGSSVIAYDAIQAVQDYFPRMVITTSAIVLFIVSFAFKSIVVSLRALVTISVTIVMVYSIANWTYCTPGILNWTRLDGLQSSGEITWVVPVLNFCVLVGLGLDYDIFLLSRIAEYRDKGYDNNDSIIHGLDKTGHIITAAGLIMAVAFGGLLFSSIALLNQSSFYLVFSVLLDTFLIRTVFVPAIMAILGDYNWYPRYGWRCGKPKGKGDLDEYMSLENNNN